MVPRRSFPPLGSSTSEDRGTQSGNRRGRLGRNKTSERLEQGYTRVGGPIDQDLCTMSESEISNLIRKRLRFRQAREFRKADAVLKDLSDHGVHVDDKSKEWWADGSGVDRRQPADNEFGHDYKKVGAPVGPSNCPLAEDEIHGRIRERARRRLRRDFDAADQIREELNKCGVQVDDELKHWWVLSRRTRRERPAVNEFGHDYARVGGPADPAARTSGEGEIHDLIRERMQLRSKGGYHKADAILEELERRGVSVDDELRLWRADGKPFTQRAYPRLKDAAPRNPSPQVKDCRTLDEAIRATHGRLGQSTTRDISAFWAVVPRHLERDDEGVADEDPQAPAQLGAILARTLEDFDAFSFRELATATLGLAKIMKRVGGDRDEEARRRGGLRKVLRDMLIGGNARNKQTILRHAARCSMSSLDEFDARCLSNLSYAYAVAGHVPRLKDGSTLLDHLAERSTPLLGEFEPRGLSNVLWAHATLAIPNQPLFQRAAGILLKVQDLGSFKSRDLASIVWAFATLGERNPDLFKRIADYIVTMDGVGAFNARDYADILWAYATAGIAHQQLFNKLAHEIGQPDKIELFTPEHLSSIVSAYATAGESQPKLFKKLISPAIARQSEFTPHGIVNFIFSYAANGCVQTEQHLFLPTVVALLGQFSSRDLSKISWAYAVANTAAPTLFNDDFTEACDDKKDEFTREELCHLYQWHLWREELKSNVKLPPILQKRCHDAFLALAPEPSDFRGDVISELALMGLQQEEHWVTARGYRIDLKVVLASGEEIGIDVCGPSCFLDRKPTGETTLRRRQIAHLEGVSLMSVPYWRWRKLGTDGDEKRRYLQSLLGLV